MYKGKRAKSTKNIYVMASLVLLIAFAVGGTVAYISMKTDPVTNTFTLGTVPIKVVEKLEDGVKKEVAIKNEGDVDAYIRAKVIVNWVSETDSSVVYGQKPTSDDYTLIYAEDTGWTSLGDYYYYTSAVAPNELTGNLISSCSPKINAETGKTPNQPEGYTLSVEILAQSIQADGVKIVDGVEKTPVELVWGEAAANAVGAIPQP